MTKRSFVCTFIAIWLLWFTDKLQAQEPLQDHQTATILILPFDNATGQKTLDGATKATADLITAFLASGTDRIQIVDRKMLETIYQEKSLTWLGVVADTSKVRTGVLSQARYIVRGSLIRDDQGDTGKIQIQAFLHETENTRLLKSFQAKGPPDHLISVCRQLASDIASFFQVRIPPTESLPIDNDPHKSYLMIYGLSALHNGKPLEAMTCLLKILDRHGQDEAAHFWLAKSFLAAELEGHARIELEAFLENFPKSNRTEQVKHLLTSLGNQ